MRLDDVVVDLAAAAAADLEHIAESGARDEPYLCAFTLEHGVRRDRRPVHEARDVSGFDAPRADHVRKRIADRSRRIRACRRQLELAQRAVGSAADDICKRAADVDADF